MSLIATSMSPNTIFGVDIILIIIPKVHNTNSKTYMSPERYLFKDYSLRVLFLNSVPFGNYQFLKISVFEQIQSLITWLQK